MVSKNLVWLFCAAADVTELEWRADTSKKYKENSIELDTTPLLALMMDKRAAIFHAVCTILGRIVDLLSSSELVGKEDSRRAGFAGLETNGLLEFAPNEAGTF